MATPPPPTLADVARACGVSLATASKALSPHLDRCDLHPDTRQRIVDAARALGWSRNRRRSARARRHWHNIGLLWGRRVPMSKGSYEHVPEVLAEILGDSFRLLITPVPLASDWRELQMSLRLDGAIALGSLDDAILADLERSEYPVVLVNLRTPRRLHQILADDDGGAAALMRHLVGLGHRRMVYLRNEWEVAHYSEADRLAAVRRVAGEAGVALVEVRGPFFDQVVAACRDGATAVVANNWWDVTGLLTALSAAGLAVPARVSVAACHDLTWFQFIAPSVTAVTVPLREMAEVGARLLLDLIAGLPSAGPAARVMPETVQIRGSTAPPPAG